VADPNTVHTAKWRDGDAMSIRHFNGADAQSEAVHRAFRAKIRDQSFPCLGAKAAVNRLSYEVGVYRELCDPSATKGLYSDLGTFFSFPDPERTAYKRVFTTYAAVFTATHIQTEREFHDLLWQQLQMIHDLDSDHYSWDTRVDPDVSSPEFSFSIGGCAFFIVGMNPLSSRLSRRFEWPALIFNPSAQFQELKAQGTFESMKAKIRRRDTLLQGTINPMLADIGERTVALIYSGIAPASADMCPLEVTKFPTP
jgi:uncharacterized protein